MRAVAVGAQVAFRRAVPMTASSRAPCGLPPMKWALALAVFAFGCGGNVFQDEIVYDDAGNPIIDGGADAKSDTRRDSGHDTSVSDSAPETWVDPMCPDAPEPKPDYRCDPLEPSPGECKAGQGCTLRVEYPEDPCEHAIYRFACSAAGTGKQGDPCLPALCAPGYVCAGWGAGFVCVKMCKPGAPGVCAEGLVCHTAVPGFGLCM